MCISLKQIVSKAQNSKLIFFFFQNLLQVKVDLEKKEGGEQLDLSFVIKEKTFKVSIVDNKIKQNKTIGQFCSLFEYFPQYQVDYTMDTKDMSFVSLLFATVEENKIYEKLS